MPRFFVDKVNGDFIVIAGDDARHIGRSLRMKIGEEIVVSCKGEDYNCKIDNISDKEVICAVLSAEPSKAEPNIKVKLFQAVPKLDKLELIVQKATELGVDEVIPVLTKRCVSRPNEKSFAKKLERLEKIALEAAKQSGRGAVPLISPLVSINKALELMSESDIKLMCYEKGGERMTAEMFAGAKTISIFIGSEGGFDADEVEMAIKIGFTPIWLGERILRCETAPLAVLAIVMNLTGNL